MMTAPHWDLSTVAKEFDVQLGKRLDAAVNRGELRWCINNRGVRWGKVITKEAVEAPLTRVDLRDLRLQAGDVLVCEGGEIGRAAVWNEEMPEAYFLNTLHRLRSRGRLHPRFLSALLQRWASTGELAALVGRATLAHLTKENLIRVPVPIPPNEEQCQIVEMLGDADDLIAALERMIAKKQAIIQGMMQQLLTGRTRLPGFTAKWMPVRLGDAGNTYGGLVGKNKADFGTGCATFVTFMEVMAGARLLGSRLERVKVGHAERQNQVLRGDILFNGSSETPEELAHAAVVDYDPSPSTYLNSFCFGYRLKVRDQINPTYLAYFFRSALGREIVSSLAQGATRYNIAKTKLMQVAPILPPIDEQWAIVEALNSSEAELDALHLRLEKARAIKTGMMQELLTGRTRLPLKEVAT